MTVYAFDRSKGAVKITERRGRFYIYRLRLVRWPRTSVSFHWEPKASESWHYKPYEDRDVFHSPSLMLEDIRTWTPYVISYN